MATLNYSDQKASLRVFVICDQDATAPIWGYIIRDKGHVAILETSVQRAMDRSVEEIPDPPPAAHRAVQKIPLVERQPNPAFSSCKPRTGNHRSLSSRCGRVCDQADQSRALSREDRGMGPPQLDGANVLPPGWPPAIGPGAPLRHRRERAGCQTHQPRIPPPSLAHEPPRFCFQNRRHHSNRLGKPPLRRHRPLEKCRLPPEKKNGRGCRRDPPDPDMARRLQLFGGLESGTLQRSRVPLLFRTSNLLPFTDRLHIENRS